jgi:hypothetical protein
MVVHVRFGVFFDILQEHVRGHCNYRNLFGLANIKSADLAGGLRSRPFPASGHP